MDESSWILDRNVPFSFDSPDVFNLDRRSGKSKVRQVVLDRHRCRHVSHGGVHGALFIEER